MRREPHAAAGENGLSTMRQEHQQSRPGSDRASADSAAGPSAVRRLVASHPLVSALAAALVSALVATVLLVFEPHTALIDKTVDDTLSPTVTAPAPPTTAQAATATTAPPTPTAPQALLSGDFRDLAHA